MLIDSPLVMCGLSYKASNRVILDNLDFVAEWGEIINVSGTSGVGKSSLFKIIAGLLKPSNDPRIIICGKNFYDYNDSDIRKILGFGMQFPGLFSAKTAIQNIVYPLKYVLNLDSNRATELATNWLTKFGMKDCENLMPRDLSGGQSQTVSLIRCLLMGYKILILDEFCSAMDSALSLRSIEAIKKYVDYTGATVIFSSHDENIANSLATRRTFLRDGKLRNFE